MPLLPILIVTHHAKLGACTGNDGFITNDANTHSNSKFNSNRPEPQKIFSHDKPNNDK